MITDLYDVIKKLREVWIKKYQKAWSNITISIENFQFKIEYDFENLQNSEFDSYERHIIWRYQYLKPDPKLLSREEREIIEDYKEMLLVERPKKQVHVEGVYKQPVKNIVDFEKMLSVEEAIAQSNQEEESKVKKRHFFGKRRKLDDIIEEEDDELINNQILNWKRDN